MTNVTPINPVVPLQPWQQRVVDEQDVLKAHIEQFAIDLAGNRSTLAKHEVVLMTSQLNAMCTYSDVLQMRIDLFNKEIDPDQPMHFPITSVAEFGNMIMGWFTKVQHDLKHMMDIPEGTEINVGASADETAPVVSITLDGEKLRAFHTGVLSAMAIVDTLPVQRSEVTPGQEQETDPTPTQVQ